MERLKQILRRCLLRVGVALLVIFVLTVLFFDFLQSLGVRFIVSG